MGKLIVTTEMLKIKDDLDVINAEMETFVNNINANLDSIVLNWEGNKSKTVLEPIETIKTKNSQIIQRIKAKSDEINKAYEAYQRSSDTTILDSTVGTVNKEPVSSVENVLPQETPVPTNQTIVNVTDDPSSQTGGLILPNIEGLKFNYDDKGNIKKYGKTDFYPVSASDGTRYLLYFGGRTPTDPIPANSQIVFGLHGSGEKAPASGSDLGRLFNNGVPNYINGSTNKPNVIAIIPQMRDKTIYSDATIDSFHEVYTNVQKSYQAKPGMDLSGISLGGQVSFKYIAKYPNDVSTATIMSGGVPYNNSSFNFSEQEINNLKNSNILMVAGKNDWKAETYKRQIDFFNKLTGSKVPNYSVTSDTPLDEIANLHQKNGGIVLVEMSDVGHNTWKYAIPTIMKKYN